MTEAEIDALAAEERVERWRQIAGFVLAPLVFVGVWLAPLDVPVPAHRLAAVLATVVVLWITESLPMAITAFAGVAAAVMLGVAPAPEAFAPFGDPLVFVFIGTFMIARAIFFHGLDRRFALTILALPGVGTDPRRVLAAFTFVTCVLSMWISNTATVAMMYPIGLSLLTVLDAHSPGSVRAYGAALLLAASFAAAAGGLATPVGTAPNLIGIGMVRRELGVDIPFFSWMAIGVPLSLAMAALIMVRLGRTGHGIGGTDALAARIAVERAALGPWTRGQVNALAAFGITVALWIFPGLVALVEGQNAPLYQHLQRTIPESVVALLGATLLFVLPTDLRRLEFTLPWREAVQIDWWIVFLYAGGIALGTLAFKTGLAEALGRGLTNLLGIESAFGLLVLSTAMAAILSETTSNTASANMVVPVVIAFARSAGVDPLLPAVGATMGASLGFMLPVSTPCNAIVYGSGRIPLTTMVREGIALDLIGIVIVVAAVGLIGPLVLGAP